MPKTAPAFDPTTVRKVRTVDTADANEHLKLGWKLIGVFQHSENDRQHPVFVVGWADNSKHENPPGWSG